MNASAIVVAAGLGIRLRSKVSKPLAKINGKAAVLYSLSVLASHPGIKEIVVVVNLANQKGMAKIIQLAGIGKVRKIILGGRRRQDSVLKGLGQTCGSCDFVVIHDAARPFISKKMVSEVLAAAASFKAAVLAVPVKATIKLASKEKNNFIVRKTLNRDKLWEVQTPQVFRRDILIKAFKRFGNRTVSDEARLAEMAGNKVCLVMGSYFNIKITTPEDLILARAICKIVNRKVSVKCPAQLKTKGGIPPEFINGRDKVTGKNLGIF